MWENRRECGKTPKGKNPIPLTFLNVSDATQQNKVPLKFEERMPYHADTKTHTHIPLM